ncbi:MAG: TIGR03086 family metal-binding protein [Streptosporangiales bacterium]|nr:TIGR03086 family metal-binding protein [Streptosporangiales bacterium]
MSDPGPRKDLESALKGAETIVAGVRPGQWDADTPCAGLDARAVAGHLAGGVAGFAAQLRGDSPPGADGDDPAAAFKSAAAELRAALKAPGVLDEVYKATPKGRGIPGALLAQVRTLELLGHGWDLARATGQPAEFGDDLAERVLAVARLTLSARPEGPDAPYGPAVPVPEDAPPIDRLAGFLGRTV